MKITIMTVCAGLEPDAVLKLRRGIEHHMPSGVEHRFLCLNDILDKEELRDGVEWVPLRHDWPAHYAKVEMWRPDLEPLGRVLFLDLSSVIQNSIQPLLDYQGDFCVVRNPWWNTPTQSVVSFTPGAGRKYYEAFRAQPEAIMELGEQNASPHFHDQTLMNIVDRGGPIDYWPEGVVASYKIGGPTPSAAVVKFHGKPKPEATEWAQKQWGINAGFPPHRTPPPNILPDRRMQNLRHTFSLGLPMYFPEEGVERVRATVVGPDVSRRIEYVKMEALQGYALVGVDESINWMNRHDLVPDIGILVEPPETVGKAKSYQVSGLCSPDTFAQLDPDETCVFYGGLTPEENVAVHLNQIQLVTENELQPAVMVFSGEHSTPILQALSLLSSMGYTQCTIHGFDCCGITGEAVDMMGRRFYCTKAQYAEAREFVALLQKLAARRAHGYLVHGDGLIASFMQNCERLGWKP